MKNALGMLAVLVVLGLAGLYLAGSCPCGTSGRARPASCLCALQQPAVTAAEVGARPAPLGTVTEAYPQLATGALNHAGLARLPDGLLLRAEGLTITQKELDAEIAQAHPAVREGLEKNAFFVLEQMAARPLLLQEVRAGTGKAEKPDAEVSEDDRLQAHLDRVAADVKVTDREIARFYEQNKHLVGGQGLEAVRETIANYLRGQKQQEAVNRHVQSIGRRRRIAVSASWAKRQAESARDNPVDQARGAGKPSLVAFFGSGGCCSRDITTPMVQALGAQYADELNVVLVPVQQHPILAARYGVRSAPFQMVFDRAGEEVFRHEGACSQERLEAVLAEVGVKQER